MYALVPCVHLENQVHNNSDVDLIIPGYGHFVTSPHEVIILTSMTHCLSLAVSRGFDHV